MSQFALKLLAMLLMLIDHTAHGLLTRQRLAPVLGAYGAYWLRTGLMAVGRMAFPMFAWFTAEGCRKTGNPKKYLLRLLVFALLSELPFRLYFDRGGAGCRNVIFTMLLAALGVFACQWMRQNKFPLWTAAIPPLLSVLLGEVLHADYHGWGVALVLLLYFMPNKPSSLLALGLWCVMFYLGVNSWTGETFGWLTPYAAVYWRYFLGAATSILPLAAYNGQRGRGSKWLFYLFYPLHLTVLYLIQRVI